MPKFSKDRIVLGDKRKKRTDYGFTRCAVAKRDRVYILSFLDALEEKGENVTKVLRWSGVWNHWIVDWAVGAICVLEHPELQVLSMGLGGRIDLRAVSGRTEEEVDTGKDGPPYRGLLRDMRVIERQVYVTGMARQVYQRLGKGQWARFDQGVLAERGKAKGIGFNSIHGFSRKAIYAVGWKGEIWRFDGRIWRPIASPTNLILERVVCVPPKTVYACGQAGVLLQGQGDEWRVIEHAATEDDFWGMEWFNGALWLATHDAIFKLVEKELEPVGMGTGDPLTCGWLDANDGVLWSVGPEDLAYFDGEKWSEVILT